GAAGRAERAAARRPALLRHSELRPPRRHLRGRRADARGARLGPPSADRARSVERLRGGATLLVEKLAWLVLVAAAAGGAWARPPAPSLALTPVWKSGTMAGVGIAGRHWIVSAECPDAVPLSYVVLGSDRQVALGAVTLRRPTGTFVFTWRVPRAVRGHVV